MIDRSLEKAIRAKLNAEKVILLFGARQVGKTTLLRHIAHDIGGYIWYNADEPQVQALFENPSSERLKNYFGRHKLVIIDEAQQLPNVGQTLKRINDSLPDVQVVATGSSSFELRNRVSEPLTGRKWEYYLFPLSFSEMANHTSLMGEMQQLHQRLVFGSYPEIVTHPDGAKERLRLLSESYLYKDILMWQNIQKPDQLVNLLRALALQVGSEVNYSELSRSLGISIETVERYILLLEQTFVIFRLASYSTNQRKELKKGKKIYFYDNGVRNALIGNYAPVEIRTDVGALWENYVVSEMYKLEQNSGRFGNFYFWRTADQQEIDLVVERDGVLSAYEIKWNSNAKVRLSKTFATSYPNHSFFHVHPGNIDEFLLK